jgi:hypothetical protein
VADGLISESGPPNPGVWAFSKSFYRADLDGFTLFHRPIKLAEIFARRRAELEAYFDANRSAGTARRNIFFVRQGGRLQCLNGAYLSEVDDALFEALLSV